MSASRLDSLARLLARGGTRRGVLALVLAMLGGLAPLGRHNAQGRRPNTTPSHPVDRVRRRTASKRRKRKHNQQPEEQQDRKQDDHEENQPGGNLGATGPDRCGDTLRRAECSMFADTFWSCPRGAQLDHANLSGCDLEAAWMDGVDLTRANLSSAKLHAVSLKQASMVAANLEEANLSVANLSGADLSSASLVGANMFAAVLDGANVTGVDWYYTICSDATISNDNGFTCCGHFGLVPPAAGC